MIKAILGVLTRFVDAGNPFLEPEGTLPISGDTIVCVRKAALAPTIGTRIFIEEVDQNFRMLTPKFDKFGENGGRWSYDLDRLIGCPPGNPVPKEWAAFRIAKRTSKELKQREKELAEQEAKYEPLCTTFQVGDTVFVTDVKKEVIVSEVTKNKHEIINLFFHGIGRPSYIRPDEINAIYRIKKRPILKKIESFPTDDDPDIRDLETIDSQKEMIKVYAGM